MWQYICWGQKEKKRETTSTPSRRNNRGRRNELVSVLHSVVERTAVGRSPLTTADSAATKNAVTTSCGRIIHVDATGRASLRSHTVLAASSCSRRGLIWTTPSRIAGDLPSHVGSLLISTLHPILACLLRCLILLARLLARLNTIRLQTWHRPRCSL
jgi:hypothetical protein